MFKSCSNSDVRSQRPEGSIRQQREFGLVVGLICAMSAWWIHRSKFGAVTPIVLATWRSARSRKRNLPKRSPLSVPSLGGIAKLLAFVMTRIVLAFVFFVVVTPIGLLRRFSRD
jgi:hypothetical protein